MANIDDNWSIDCSIAAWVQSEIEFGCYGLEGTTIRIRVFARFSVDGWLMGRLAKDANGEKDNEKNATAGVWDCSSFSGLWIIVASSVSALLAESVRVYRVATRRVFALEVNSVGFIIDTGKFGTNKTER